MKRLAQILKERWTRWRRFTPIIEALPVTRKDAGDGVVVRRDAVIAHKRIENALRKQIAAEVRNIAESSIGKRIFAPYASAGYDNNFPIHHWRGGAGDCAGLSPLLYEQSSRSF